jgi:biopolymer transport protein ExbD/biopolymer transport protein TolR
VAYKPKAPDLNPDINVVPMADIMLVLLIIFMVVTPMLQKGYSVELARTETARSMEDADKEDAVLIAVTKSGNIFLGNEQISIETIKDKIQDRIAARANKVVYVKSDARAKYGMVVKVVDEVRTTGVDQIGLLTEKVEGTRRPPAVMPMAAPGGTSGTP